MSQFVRITLACPVAFIAAANELARCIGYSEADGKTFVAATHRDAQASEYALSSGLVERAFLTDAFSPLVEPAWGADMAAARQAQEWLAVYDPDTDEPPFASPVHIACVVGAEPDAALSVLGVTVAP